MGVTVYLLYLASACALVVHYGSVYANIRCEESPAVFYSCPDDKYCCNTDEGKCCQTFFTPETTTAIVVFSIFIVFATIMVCAWCIYTRYALKRWRGTVVTSVTVVSGDAQNLPQGQPSWCPPPQPMYPPKANEPPPPEYYASAPNPVGNSQVVPPATVVPIGFALTAKSPT